MNDPRPVVSFRAPADLHLKLEQARATFPKQQWAEVFVWLFDKPAVKELLHERVTADTGGGVRVADQRTVTG